MMKSEAIQKLALRFLPDQGIRLWDIPIQLNTAALSIIGENQVEGVKIAKVTAKGEPIAGTETIIPADFVCIAGGLQPLVELAAVAGCTLAYLPELGGHVPLHNERMQTTVNGLYVAGNITGIESAKIAMAQGTVAGLSIADDFGMLLDQDLLHASINKVESVRQTAAIQFHPDIQKGRSAITGLFQQHHIGV